MNILKISGYSSITGLFRCLFLAAIIGLAGACTRAIDEPLRSVKNNTPDTTTNIQAVLAASPFHLFNQAYNRLALDSSFSYYTIFAPTDAVMQAAGLTASVIDTLSRDSLYKIIAYHVAQGSFSDSLLASLPTALRVPTMRKDVLFVPQP